MPQSRAPESIVTKTNPRLWWLVAPVPALILGALIMRQHDVPPSRWGLNLIGGAVAAVICAVFLARPRTSISKTAAIVVACAGATALAATFAVAGSMGVHRWIPLGPLTIHAGAVCLPLIILSLGVLLKCREGRGRRRCCSRSAWRCCY
jgi:cell division protein FtsW (lipid II flippase)